jgi:putative cardiolipin synthase
MKKLLFGLALSLSIASVFATEKAGDTLLSETIPYPFYDVQKVSEGKENYLTVINSGVAALEKRLDMIRSAKENVEVEYFIYALDQSSKLITLELIKAAERGVKVRVLVDKSGTIFQLDEYYAKALSEKGVEVRYYNAAALVRISSINFRNHRKLISVDDRIAITGGRNVEDDYYDLSPEYNFVDRDVIVEGPMVKTMRESFDYFFEDRITERPELPVRPPAMKRKRVRRAGSAVRHYRMVDNSRAVNKYLERLETARAFATETVKDIELAQNVEALATPVIEAQTRHLCPEITYSTDKPGGNFFTRLFEKYSDNYRFLRKTLHDKISRTNHKLFLSSPYILNNRKTRRLMNELLDNNVEISMYTNSLASTDALYIAANLYKDIFHWARLGMNTYVHSGAILNNVETIDDSIQTARWGTHSKTQIYDSLNDQGELESEVMIGTYNIDNRSNHYNTEMAIFCKGSEGFTKDVRDSVERRLEGAYKVNGDRTAVDSEGNRVSVFGTKRKGLKLAALIALPSWLLKFLL